MLGKGLESLIPQKGNVANQQPTGPNTTPSLNTSRVIPGIFSPGNAAVVPQTLPAEPVRIDLSAPKDELELPARPAGTEIVAPQEFSAPKPDGPTMPVVPVILYRPDSSGAEAYRRLADEVIADEMKTSVPEGAAASKDFGDFNV